MSTKKMGALRGKRLIRHLTYRAFGAAGIRHQCVRRGQSRHFGQYFDRVADRQSNVNQIRAGNRERQVGKSFVDGAAFERLPQNMRFVPADDGVSGECLRSARANEPPINPVPRIATRRKEVAMDLGDGPADGGSDDATARP